MKAALYCRLSEEDRNKSAKTDDSESIQNQKTMLLQYTMDKGWDVYSIYSDDDYTGADRNRPAFNRLLQDAEDGKFSIILCKTQSRFTREMELVEKYIHGLFPIWGIRFVSIVDNADTENKGNKKARQINGLINEWYLEDMSDNIKSVLTSRRKNGFHIGSFALYGYRKDPDRKGHLLIDEDAAEIVREIFTLFAQGYGKTAIARMLNDRGVPNPTEYKRQKGLRYQSARNRNCTLWKYFSIADMLTNEAYIGNLVQGKYGSISYKSKVNKPNPKDKWIRVEGTHEPIIGHELWNRVQKLVQSKHRPFKCGQIGIFAKKVFCAHCEYTMRSSKSHGLYYLKCPTRHSAKDACIGSFVSVNTLEKVVLSELHGITAEYLDINELENQVTLMDTATKNTRLKETLGSYKKKLTEYQKGFSDLYMDKVRGTISEDEYQLLAENMRQEKDRLETLVSETESVLEKMQQRKNVSADKQKIIIDYLHMEKLNRDTVDKLIDKIYIGKRNPETKQLPIDIHWNF